MSIDNSDYINFMIHEMEQQAIHARNNDSDSDDEFIDEADSFFEEQAEQRDSHLADLENYSFADNDADLAAHEIACMSKAERVDHFLEKAIDALQEVIYHAEMFQEEKAKSISEDVSMRLRTEFDSFYTTRLVDTMDLLFKNSNGTYSYFKENKESIYYPDTKEFGFIGGILSNSRKTIAGIFALCKSLFKDLLFAKKNTSSEFIQTKLDDAMAALFGPATAIQEWYSTVHYQRC